MSTFITKEKKSDICYGYTGYVDDQYINNDERVCKQLIRMNKDKIISNLELMRAEVEWEYSMEYAATIDSVIEILKNYNVKQGHWEKVKEQPYFRKHFGKKCCSICKKYTNKETNFCSNCGAYMMGDNYTDGN